MQLTSRLLFRPICYIVFFSSHQACVLPDEFTPEAYSSYVAHMAAATSSMRLHEAREAKYWLRSAPGDHVFWEWRMLHRLSDQSIRHQSTPSWAAVNLSFSSDGKEILVAGDDGQIRLLDSDSLQTRQQFRVSEQSVYAVRYSPDGMTLAACARDGQISLWSRTAGEKIWSQPSGGEGLADLAIHPSGEKLAFCSWYRSKEGVKGIVSLWSMESGTKTWQQEFGVKPIVVVRFSPQGDRFAVGTWDGLVGIWPFENPLQPQELGFQDVKKYSAIDDLAFSPDGKRLAAASKNGSPRIWNLETNKVLMDLIGHLGAVTSVEFTPEGKYLISGGTDGVIGLWDLSSETLLHRFLGHDKAVLCLATRPNAQEVVSGSRDGTLRVWDREHAGELDAPNRSLFAYGGTVSRDGKLYAAGGQDPSIVTVWDAETRRPVRTLDGLTGSVNYLDFGPDYHLAGGNWAGDVLLWDANNGGEGVALEKHDQGGMHQCALSADGRWLAASTSKSKLAIWDVATRKLVRQISLEVPAWGVDFCPDSTTIALGLADGSLRTYRTESGDELTTAKIGKSQLNAVKFSPSGRWIACGGEDGQLALCTFPTLEILWNVPVHNQRIWSLDFLPDETRIASGGSDGILAISDQESGMTVLRHAGFPSDIYNLAFSPVTQSLFINATRAQMVLEVPTAKSASSSSP